MATQPTTVKILVDWTYALVLVGAVARAKTWDAQCHIELRIDDGPAGDPDANLRLYDPLEEQNQRSSYFMVGLNLHGNLQRWSGQRQLPLYH